MFHRGFRMFGGGGIVGIVLVLVVAYFIIKYFNENKDSFNKTKQRNKPEKPIDILDERYARGEINEEEYNRRKKILKK